MKTSKQIKHVNSNDIQFILGKSPNEAKSVIAKALNIKEVNSKGIPLVKASDKAPVEDIDFTIRSNSALDGACYFEVIVDRFNQGIDMGALRNFGEDKRFIKKLKFTGKYHILNEIMNDDQYLKLQKIWLFSNVYGKKKPSLEAQEFISKNDWAKEYLKTKGIVFKEVETV